MAAVTLTAVLSKMVVELREVAAIAADAGLEAGIRSIDASATATVASRTATMVGLALAAVAGYYKFQLFREGRPHLTINLNVSDRAVNSQHIHIGVIATLSNTSKVAVDVRYVMWELAAIAPYDQDGVEILEREFFESDIPQGDELGWRRLRQFTMDKYEIMIEPGETDEISFDFIAPAGLESALVTLFVRNEESTGDEEEMGWYRRAFHDMGMSTQDINRT